MRCRESARLLSEQQDHPLTLRKRIGLRFHLLLCRLCQVYASQISAVSRISNAAGIASPDRCPGSLSEDRRRRIQAELEKR